MRTLDRANVKTFAFEGDESIFGGAAFVSDAVGSLLDSLEDESPVQARSVILPTRVTRNFSWSWQFNQGSYTAVAKMLN